MADSEESDLQLSMSKQEWTLIRQLLQELSDLGLLCKCAKRRLRGVKEWFNRPVIHNRNRFVDLINQDSKTRGLVTVSNHDSCMDDPLLWAMRGWSQIWSICRWTPTAEEICFTSKATRWFFSMGRCVPIVRGDGVYQKGMDFCLSKLNEGEWVHIFPEGGVNMTKENKRFKWGVGRLIAECVTTPVVLPMYHVGMDNILPNKQPYIPQIRQDVTVLVGEPQDYTEDLNQLRKQNKSPMEVRKYITDKIQEEVWNLKEKAEKLHRDRVNRTES